MGGRSSILGLLGFVTLPSREIVSMWQLLGILLGSGTRLYTGGVQCCFGCMYPNSCNPQACLGAARDVLYCTAAMNVVAVAFKLSLRRHSLAFTPGLLPRKFLITSHPACVPCLCCAVSTVVVVGAGYATGAIVSPWLLFGLIAGMEAVRGLCLLLMRSRYPQENLSAP